MLISIVLNNIKKNSSGASIVSDGFDNASLEQKDFVNPAILDYLY